jgi:hypothetical protein
MRQFTIILAAGHPRGYKLEKETNTKFFTIGFSIFILGIVVLSILLVIRNLAETENSQSAQTPTILSTSMAEIPTAIPMIVENKVTPSPIPDTIPSGASQSPAPSMPRVEMNGVLARSEDYISNPNIGLQWDTGDPRSNYLPETVAYERGNISWRALNPNESVYNWPVVDQFINLAKSQNKDLSIRIFTMIGEIYGGHEIPQFVLDKGAVLLPSGEPDYSNCVYQAEWAKFVEAFIRQYDGHPDISFIDISGYGNFNEWSWHDQTEWDDLWESNYRSGSAAPSSFTTLDGQARRRLADMFIGGTFSGHQCRRNDGRIETVDYSYGGFRKSQLVMPFAGIIQSSQYVFSRREDIGFRFDCLGRNATGFAGELNAELSSIWRKAPVVFEFCKPHEVQMPDAKFLLDFAHGSLVHNNEFPFGRQDMLDLLTFIGYRYVLKEYGISGQIQPGGALIIEMNWQNVGNAPYYPRMGHIYELQLSLENTSGSQVLNTPIAEDIAAWMPAENAGGEPPDNRITANLFIPANLPPGEYIPVIRIVDLKTGQPINLAMADMADRTGFRLPPIAIQ